MIDLHTHSNCSDGSLSPADLIRTAAAAGLTVLALTDHDTIAGNAEAAEAAMEAGIRFIPGIEFDIHSDVPGDFHLLGLNVTAPSADFQTELEALTRRREERNQEICAKLRDLGIQIAYEEVVRLAAPGIIGRPHFATWLVQAGVVKKRDLAFERYLGRGKPAYAPKVGITWETAVRLIHESGGQAFIAHPKSLYLSRTKLRDFIAELAYTGLDGVEAWHPGATVKFCRTMEEYARSLGLRVSAGSDFHGDARPDRKLGRTAGGQKIDERFCLFQN
jgi:predicted metal-dependent phosphoesterase TrpH